MGVLAKTTPWFFQGVVFVQTPPNENGYTFPLTTCIYMNTIKLYLVYTTSPLLNESVSFYREFFTKA